MQQTSELWKTLLATPGTSRVYKFSVDGVEMGENTESGHSITHALFENLSIGSAQSASLHYEVYTDSIVSGQKIERFVRLENGMQISEWLPAGVFFVNTADVEDGLWTVEAVDAIRKANIPWIPEDGEEFPMPMNRVMELTAQIVGVEIDPRSEFESTYALDYPTEGYTIRNLWQYVATAHGGNVIITPEGKLLQVRMYGDRDQETVKEGGYTSLVDNGNRPSVSRVTRMRDQSNGDTAGDDTGTEIKGTCFTATEEMATDILGRLSGIEYQAYSCSAAGLDPAAELGDAVDFGELQGIIFRIEDDGYGFPNLSCPGERMIDEKYPEDGPITSEMRRELRRARAEITKTASEITLMVQNRTNVISSDLNRLEENTNESLDSVNQSIQELTERVGLSVTPDQVEIAIEKKLTQGVDSVTTKTGFTFDDEGLTVSKTGSEMTTQVTEDGMTVSRSGTQVLVVDNQGVEATNLHAKTFLILAGKARLEPYGADRMGCFWIGG